jgi:hypothetical protein
MIYDPTLVAIDQTINSMIWINGERGSSDETLSARLFRLYLQDQLSDRWYRLIDSLVVWEDAHCYRAWRAEMERRQLPDHYRGRC